MNNAISQLPSFDFDVETLVADVETAIEHAKAQIEALHERTETDWDWYADLEKVDVAFQNFWSPVAHLNAVATNPALREAHDKCIQLITAWSTERGQDERMLVRYQYLAERTDGSKAHKYAVELALRDFRLSGVDLPEAQKSEVAQIKNELAQLGNQFSNHLVDSVDGWVHVVADESQLEGVPAANIAQAKAVAQQKNLEGYALTLDIPQYLAVMTYAKNRALRQTVYEAFSARASEFDAFNTELDNADIIVKTLGLREALAGHLGFENYASLSLARKMAESNAQVIGFLNDLADKAVPAARAEFAALQQYATQQGFEADLEPWDVSFWAERLRIEQYEVSDQEIKEYLPVDRAISGLFEVVSKLFAVDISKDDSVETWHDDATFYWIEREGRRIAGFYFDLFAREGKRGGAWMADARVRRVSGEDVQLPIAFLTCNFGGPTEDVPSLLTHNDLTTLFHEFGHGLHHMLTRIDVAAVSGINGVAWDAVELPSQWLENWCWDRNTLKSMSSHYQTGEPMSDALIDKMLAAKNFQSAMFMVRQLEFSLFDFELHCEKAATQYEQVEGLLSRVRDRVCVVPVHPKNRFACSFGHIFAGGYAAGYYSYKWAEVLSADAFDYFEEQGIYNRDAAKKFEDELLSQGGSAPAQVLYRAFRGRDATVDALLRHNGIGEAHV